MQDYPIYESLENTLKQSKILREERQEKNELQTQKLNQMLAQRNQNLLDMEQFINSEQIIDERKI